MDANGVWLRHQNAGQASIHLKTAPVPTSWSRKKYVQMIVQESLFKVSKFVMVVLLTQLVGVTVPLGIINTKVCESSHMPSSNSQKHNLTLSFKVIVSPILNSEKKRETDVEVNYIVR